MKDGLKPPLTRLVCRALMITVLQLTSLRAANDHSSQVYPLGGVQQPAVGFSSNCDRTYTLDHVLMTALLQSESHRQVCLSDKSLHIKRTLLALSVISDRDGFKAEYFSSSVRRHDVQARWKCAVFQGKRNSAYCRTFRACK